MTVARLVKQTALAGIAALALTACAGSRNTAPVAAPAAVSEEEAVATMEKIAGIVMSGPVEVDTIVANEPGSAFAIVSNAGSSAVIKSINAPKRSVTLQTQDGRTKKLTAGPAVEKFDQLRAGDTVKVNYTEILAIYLEKDAAARVNVATGLARKEDGTPGAALFGESKITLKVLELDKAARRVKLELPDTTVREAVVRDGVDLSKVKVGDSVTASIAKALVIEVAK